MSTTLFNRTVTRARTSSTFRRPLTVLCVFLLFDYLRIHDMIPILGKLRIQTVFVALLLFVVVRQVRETQIRTAPQSRLLLGFLALAFFTFPLATNWFYAYQFAYVIAVTLVGYFAIVYILRSEQDLRTFLAWFVGIHIFLAARYKGGHAGGYFLGDENDFSLALNIAWPIAIYLFRQAPATRSRVCWGVGIGAMLTAIVLSSSRGGFVGLVAIAVYWAITSRKKGEALGTLALAGILVIAVAPPEYWTRIQTITSTNEGTAQERQYYWAAARREFMTSPIWGVGGGNFGVLLPDYADDWPEELRANQWGRATHSLYYQILAEFGLLGVFLIGAVLVLSYRDVRHIRALGRKGKCSRALEQLAECLQLSWVGFMVSGAFISVLTYPHLYYLTALTIVVHRFALEQSIPATPLPSKATHSAIVRRSTAR
jgi:putative inorganic carbon (hco3(-)) transporter